MGVDLIAALFLIPFVLYFLDSPCPAKAQTGKAIIDNNILLHKTTDSLPLLSRPFPILFLYNEYVLCHLLDGLNGSGPNARQVGQYVIQAQMMDQICDKLECCLSARRLIATWAVLFTKLNYVSCARGGRMRANE